MRIGMNNAGAAANPWDESLPGAHVAGTAGYIIGTNINATISSRASQTSVDDVPTNAELATAIITGFTTDLPEDYPTAGATRSARDMLYSIESHVGRSSFSGTTKTLHKINNVTIAKTHTLTLSGSDPIAITETT